MISIPAANKYVEAIVKDLPLMEGLKPTILEKDNIKSPLIIK